MVAEAVAAIIAYCCSSNASSRYCSCAESPSATRAKCCYNAGCCAMQGGHEPRSHQSPSQTQCKCAHAWLLCVHGPTTFGSSVSLAIALWLLAAAPIEVSGRCATFFRLGPSRPARHALFWAPGFCQRLCKSAQLCLCFQDCLRLFLQFKIASAMFLSAIVAWCSAVVSAPRVLCFGLTGNARQAFVVGWNSREVRVQLRVAYISDIHG